MNKFYFTFGSLEQFPYQDTYLIIIADDLAKAIAAFREKYPDRHPNTVNCSDWYDEKRWERIKRHYDGISPAEVLYADETDECKDIINELYKYAEDYKKRPTRMEIKETPRLLEEAAKLIEEARYSVFQLKKRYMLGMLVHRQGDDEMDSLECPVCGHKVGRNDDFEEFRPQNCPACGTRLIY